MLKLFSCLTLALRNYFKINKCTVKFEIM